MVDFEEKNMKETHTHTHTHTHTKTNASDAGREQVSLKGDKIENRKKYFFKNLNDTKA
jgi:hypothetical protein